MLNTRKFEVFVIKYAIYSSLITQKLIAWLLNVEMKRFNGLTTYLKKLV